VTRQVRPTPQQLRAALASAPNINIEAAPGSGKTTVAAERFGLYRYTTGVEARGVLALSFTRSARRELADRVRSRWGSGALVKPHVALTFDVLHRLLLDVLLDEDRVTWAHGGQARQVLNSWQGATGARRLGTGAAYWVARLNGTAVRHRAAQAPHGGVWMSTAAGLAAQLGAGVCTHQDVRSIVHDALRTSGLRAALIEAVRARFRAVIVDEVYDANAQDLDLLALLCEAGLPVTLIGDRWQALYGFRGARPDLVPGVLTQYGFLEHEVSRSFRYATPELEASMAALRTGAGLALPAGDAAHCDAVLATGWDSLWQAGKSVLPIGLGALGNKSDALLTVLLNRVTLSQIGQEARNYAEACFLLKVPLESSERDRALDEFLSDLRTGTPPTFEALRTRHGPLGLDRKPARLASAANEAKLDAALLRLRDRLDGHPLVPGLSVHQAKGREYDRVGLRLKAPEVSRLTAGLDPIPFN